MRLIPTQAAFNNGSRSSNVPMNLDRTECDADRLL